MNISVSNVDMSHSVGFSNISIPVPQKWSLLSSLHAFSRHLFVRLASWQQDYFVYSEFLSLTWNWWLHHLLVANQRPILFLSLKLKKPTLLLVAEDIRKCGAKVILTLFSRWHIGSYSLCKRKIAMYRNNYCSLHILYYCERCNKFWLL